MASIAILNDGIWNAVAYVYIYFLFVVKLNDCGHAFYDMCQHSYYMEGLSFEHISRHMVYILKWTRQAYICFLYRGDHSMKDCGHMYNITHGISNGWRVFASMDK